MEPLDTDYDYVPQQRRLPNPRTRFNWLFIIPALGLLWLLYLIAAAIFQFPVTGAVNPVLGFMIVIFFVIAGLLLWALAPKANR